MNSNVSIPALSTFIHNNPYITDICEQEGFPPDFLSISDLYNSKYANKLRSMVTSLEKAGLDLAAVREKCDRSYETIITSYDTINPYKQCVGVFPWAQRISERLASDQLLSQISTLLQEFDPTKVGAVVISKITLINRNGEEETFRHIEDGLGRIIAAFILNTEIPVIMSVKKIESIQDDFYDINTNSYKPGPFESVKKHLKDRDPLHVFAHQWLKTHNITWTEFSPMKRDFYLQHNTIPRFLKMVGEYGGVAPDGVNLHRISGSKHSKNNTLAANFNWTDVMDANGPWMTRGLQLYNKLFFQEDPNASNRRILDLSIFGGCVLYAVFMSKGNNAQPDSEWQKMMEWLVAAFQHKTKDGFTLDTACKTFAIESNAPFITDHNMDTLREKSKDSWMAIIRNIGLKGAAGQPRRVPDVICNLFLHIEDKYQTKSKKKIMKTHQYAIIPNEVMVQSTLTFHQLMKTSMMAYKQYADVRAMWLKSWKVAA